MSEDEILQAYNILSQNVKDQAARDAAIIGNSQRSLGPLAARVASPTGQTSGLANYTYNRLMRPVVDSTAAALTTQGTAQALNKNLADALRAAKNAYQDAQNNYTTAASAAQAANRMNIVEATDGSTAGTIPTPTNWEEQAQAAQTKLTEQTFNDLQTNGKRYFYVLNGVSYPFTIFGSGSLGGVETPQMSYTADAGREFLRQLRAQGARFYQQGTGADVTNQLIF